MGVFMVRTMKRVIFQEARQYGETQRPSAPRQRARPDVAHGSQQEGADRAAHASVGAAAAPAFGARRAQDPACLPLPGRHWPRAAAAPVALRRRSTTGHVHTRRTKQTR